MTIKSKATALLLSKKPITMVEKMIQNLEEKTGHKMSYWIKIVKKSGEEKHMSKVKYLKENHGLSHGYANLIVHISKESPALNKPTGDLVATQYSKGKENLKPIYDALIKRIKSLGNDVEIAPKKAYVSVRRKKQFAIIQPSTKTRIDIGIKFKEKETTERLLSAKTFRHFGQGI